MHFQRWSSIEDLAGPQLRTKIEVIEDNQTLQYCLVKLVNKEHDNWDEYIDVVLFTYRTSRHLSTNVTPFEFMYCRYFLSCISMKLSA